MYVCLFLAHRTMETEPKYYADGEDAYAMRRDLIDWAQQHNLTPPNPKNFFAPDRRGRRQQNSKEVKDSDERKVEEPKDAKEQREPKEQKEQKEQKPESKKKGENKSKK